RYQATPTFGWDVIRKFTNDASGMKNMTAHGYQDLLLCCLPAIEGILPKYDHTIQDVTFCAANWLLLAKLHSHTSATITLLCKCTSVYGSLTHKFTHDTNSVPTVKTPNEADAHQRREAKVAATGTTSGTGVANTCSAILAASTIGTGPQKSQEAGGPHSKKFSLQTYKWHAMGHVADAIEEIGSTESYSTSRVCQFLQGDSYFYY
ncbi:hypothetical protein BS47DRAFT_1309187, partial [Hydnum rufescens UP504]